MQCRHRIVLAITFAAFLNGAVNNATAEEPQPPKGFRALFNGTDLSGWYGWNPHASAKLTGDQLEANLKQQREEFATHWRVENGELVNDGHGPYATTEEDLGDVDLMIEYKTVPKADSGIYLRGTPQVQIWDYTTEYNPKAPQNARHLGSGGLYNNTYGTLGQAPLRFSDKPFGQWNSFRIKQIGDRTWVWLNGKEVVSGSVMENYWDRSQPLPATGPLMLQTHGGEIRWRNIFVRNISEKEGQSWLASHPPIPEPTAYDVSYGPHSKNVIHFWKAESQKPAPVLLFIHGGGWMSGGRLSGLTGGLLQQMLDNGISVASVEYRFIPEATADGVVPPVHGPLHDAARALQFVRSKADEWNIDKTRIAASGGSAGACSSLWLAFHDDLADPDSDDPVARESTRLHCAAVRGAQTTLDPVQMKEWTPNSRYGAHAFAIVGDGKIHKSPFEAFVAKRDEIAPWIAEYSPYALVSSDDPPVHLHYSAPPALGQDQKDPTHTSNFGVKLQEHCQANGVSCELFYPGAEDVQTAETGDYLVKMLTAE